MRGADAHAMKTTVNSRLASMIACAALPMMLPSCISYPGGYDGYMARSYAVRGQSYQPMSIENALDYDETGVCSWYNESSFFGLKRGNTSLGEKVMPWHLTGAHKTLPLPCMVKVTNVKNGKSVKIRINSGCHPACGEKTRVLRPGAGHHAGRGAFRG
jgi:rare lipoprotein A